MVLTSKQPGTEEEQESVHDSINQALKLVFYDLFFIVLVYHAALISIKDISSINMTKMY